MKRLLLLITVGFVGQSFAQNLIHTKGIDGISLGGGYANHGYSLSASYRSFFMEKTYLKGAVNFEKGEIGFSSYETYILGASAGYSPFNIKQKNYINIEGGAIAGWENTLPIFDQPSQTDFIYGFKARVENEFFFTSNFSLIINFTQMMTFNSPFGMFRYQVGVTPTFYF